MDERRDRTDEGWDGRYVAPVGRVGRRTSVAPWVAVATVALVLAILKPWGSTEGPPPSGTPDGSPSVPTSARDDPDLLSRCHNTDAWLLSTVEASRGQTVKVLRVLSPSPSVKPEDPAIPRVVFGSERVIELGWCAPVVGPARSPGVTNVQAWSIVAGRALKVGIGGDVPVGSSAFGMLYRPPPDGSADAAHRRPARGGPLATASWATGVYVFTLRDTTGAVHTFAVDLEIIPPRAPAATTLPVAPS